MNKQNKISLILGVLVLTVLIVTSSFAFFQITNTGNTETNTSFTGSLEDIESYGTASLSGPNNKLHIKIKASDMAKTKAGTYYYATVNPDLDYELDKQNHLISTASIKNGEGNDDVVYECTSDLLIEASGSLVTDNVIDVEDGNIYFGGKGSTIEPTEISLKDIIDAQSEGGYKKQVKYKITGNGEATLTTDIDIINRDDDQNDIAGKEIDLTITNKNLVCTVKGLEEKAYMVKLGYEDTPVDDIVPMFTGVEEWFDSSIRENVISAAFVNYIPSDLEDSKIVKYIDLSDTEKGTKKGSVIAWVEETNEHNGEYNFYIGSESKIYAEYLNIVFAYMNKLQSVDFSNLDTSETISMEGMFDMGPYFYGDGSMVDLDLSGLDTSHVTDMSYMFRKSNANITFPEGFGSSATDMSNMFYQYQGTELDLSSFDTSSVTNMYSMFERLSIELPFKDWPNFVTTNVENMGRMFAYYKGTNLDLSTFDTSKVTNMSGMFRFVTTDLPFKDWSNFDTSKVTDMNDMFYGYKGTSLDLSTFDTSSVTDMSWMFVQLSINLSFKNWPNFVTTNVEDMSNMFNQYQGTELDLSTFDTSKVTNMSGMFDGATVDLPFKDWPNFITTSVESMSEMFRYYEGTTLDLSSFDTSKVENMNYMFNGCTNLTELKMNKATFDGLTTEYSYYNMFGSNSYRVPSNIHITVKKGQEQFIIDRLTEIYPDYDYTNNITTVD